MTLRFREFYAQKHPGEPYPGRSEEYIGAYMERVADACADYMDYLAAHLRHPRPDKAIVDPESFFFGKGPDGAG